MTGSSESDEEGSDLIMEANGIALTITAGARKRISGKNPLTDTWSKLTRGVEKIFGVVKNSGKVTKTEQAEILGATLEIFALATSALNTKCSAIRGEYRDNHATLLRTLQSQKKAIDALTEKLAEGPTHASYARAAASKGAREGPEPPPPKRHIVVIEPITPKQGQTASQVKDEVAGAFSPSKEKVKIKSVWSTKAKKVVLETATAEDLNKIKSLETLTKSFKITEPKKRKPLVILYDVDASLEPADLIKKIGRQNDVSTEHVTARFKTGPKDQATVHWVLEADPETRKKLLNAGRVYVGYQACKAKDFLQVTRCMKCNDLGHPAKYCKGEECCSRCGETGHRKGDCTKQRVCVPCSKRKLKCKKPGSDQCQARKFVEARLKEGVDYGD